MKKRVRLTESDIHRIVKKSINKILKEDYGKGNKYTYKTEDGDTADCEFVTSTFEDGYPYSVGLIDHYKKEVYPCHGYHYPNRCANGLMKKALSLGYTYVDSEMPTEKNKTLLKKQYKNRVIKESVKKMLSENIDAHLGIDDICNLLGGGDEGYDTLNKILWSLQEQGVINFDEDALDRLYNSPNY